MTLAFEADLSQVTYTIPAHIIPATSKSPEKITPEEVGTISSGDKFVLVALADNAADDGSSIYPSIETLIKKTQMSARGCQIALRHIQGAKLLDLEYEEHTLWTPKGLRRTRTYRLNVDLLATFRRPEKKVVDLAVSAGSAGETPHPVRGEPRSGCGGNPAVGAPDSSVEPSTEPSDSQNPAPTKVDAIATKTPGSILFEAYGAAYKLRHGVEPTRGHRSNSICKDLASRVSVEEAAGIAQYYVSGTERLYEAAKHPLTLLARHFDKFRTEFLTGRRPAAEQPFVNRKTAGNREAIVRAMQPHIRPEPRPMPPPARPALEAHYGD
jgi:hypothetical protein